MCLKSVSVVDSFGTAESSILGKSLCIIDILMDSCKNALEGLYYPCSENKGADQLCGYCEADLRLCFRICKKPVFS